MGNSLKNVIYSNGAARNSVQKQKNGVALIKKYILKHYNPGDKLPTSEILSAKAGTSEYAVVRAMNDLSLKGMVERRPRIGTYLISKGTGSNEKRNAIPMVAFVADNLEFYMEVIGGIEEGCRENKMAAALVKSGFDPGIESDHLHHLSEDGYAGAIIRQSWWPSSLRAARDLRDSGFPVVFIDNKNDDKLDIPCVRPDHEQASYDATKYLIERGHRRIGHVTEHADIKRRMDLIREAEAGYKRALTEVGIEIRPEYIVRASDYVCENEVGNLKFIETIGYEPTHRLISLPEPPTAITFGHYFLAVAGYRTIVNHGLRIPDDVSIIGIDGDGPEFRYMPVPLTTMCEEKKLIGKTAAELMGKILNNEKIDNKLVKIKSRLIERKSVASR